MCPGCARHLPQHSHQPPPCEPRTRLHVPADGIKLTEHFDEIKKIISGEKNTWAGSWTAFAHLCFNSSSAASPGLSRLQLRGAVTQQREQLFIFQMELTKPCQYYGEDLLPGSTALPASPEVFPLNPPHLVTLRQQETVSWGKKIKCKACMGTGLGEEGKTPSLYLP